MEVIITKNFIKELAKLPKPIISLADNVIDKLHAANRYKKAELIFLRWKDKEKMKIITE